jgi:hypothetical protein
VTQLPDTLKLAGILAGSAERSLVQVDIRDPQTGAAIDVALLASAIGKNAAALLDVGDGEPLSDRQRLLALFDAAYGCRCDLVLWEHDEPDAPEALGAWATARDVVLAVRRVDISLSDAVVAVPKAGGCGRIEVYCKRAAVVVEVAA